MNLHAHMTAILDELRQALIQADNERAARLVESITRARRIFVAGAGRSGLMMKGFAMRLMHLGLNVSVVGETVTPGMTDGDLLLIGSGSGATASLVNYAATARTIGATIALLTIQADSPIGRMADIILTIPAPTPKIDQAPVVRSVQPMGSLFEQALMVTLDALVLMLMAATGRDAKTMFAYHANLE